MLKSLPWHIILIGLGLMAWLAPPVPCFEDQKTVNSKKGIGQVMDFILIGIVVSSDASSSVAMLRNETTGSVMLLKVGENVQDLKLLQVLKDRAVFSDGLQTFEFFLNVKAVGQTRELPRKVLAPTIPREDADFRAASMVITFRKEFLKDEIEKRIWAELPRIMKEAQMVPHIAGGGINGVRIVKWPSGSNLLSDVGICEGDVIKQINDIKLNDASVLPRLQQAFLESSHFDVIVERGGKLIRFHYVLKDSSMIH